MPDRCPSDAVDHDVGSSHSKFTHIFHGSYFAILFYFTFLHLCTIMTSRLRILAGPDTSSLKPITHLVNTGKAFEIKSDAFEGKILVYIQGLTSEVGDGDTGNAYFHSPNRTGVTWSIQAQGMFTHVIYRSVYC
jgi:hypothetical protein